MPFLSFPLSEIGAAACHLLPFLSLPRPSYNRPPSKLRKLTADSSTTLTMRRQSNSNLLAATLAIATTLAVVQGFDSATLHGPDVHAAAVAGHKTLHKHESPHSAVIAAAKRANIWSADREEKIVQPLKSFWIDTFPQLTALSKEQWRKDLGLHPLIVNELIRDGILPADKSLREKALHPHAGHGKGIPGESLSFPLFSAPN